MKNHRFDDFDAFDPTFLDEFGFILEEDYEAEPEVDPAELDELYRGESAFDGITLGTERDAPVFQLNEDRFRHTAIIGRTGSGKSNHLLQMEREDIRNGYGVAIIAAHEEDALYPLSCVPKSRKDDVVIIDPTNTRLLPCLNPLDVDRTDRAAVSKAVSDCLQLLKSQCFHEWAGPRFDQMARLALETMLDPGFPAKAFDPAADVVLAAQALRNPRAASKRVDPDETPHLGLIERMYNDPDFVRGFIDKLSDEHLREAWRLEARSHRSSDADDKVQWFLSKIDPFCTDRVLKNIFGPGKRTIDIKRIVDEGKILVAIIPEHRIGHDAAAVLRAWLFMQLKDAIMQRGSTADGGYYGICGRQEPDDADELAPFFVYVDEFEEHAVPEFASFLAEARKFRVGFTLAFQNLEQLRAFDVRTGHESDKVLSAVLCNVGTTICYPVGSADVMPMARHLNVQPMHVARIRRYEPLARVMFDNEQDLVFLDVPRKPEPDNPDMLEALAENQIVRNIWLPVRQAKKRQLAA